MKTNLKFQADYKSKKINERSDCIAKNCCIKDWNGIREKPIKKATIDAARTFLMAFPTAMALPEIDPSPDGEITISWSQGFRYILTFSIGRTSMPTYIWINGKEFGHGEIEFHKGDVIDASKFRALLETGDLRELAQLRRFF